MTTENDNLHFDLDEFLEDEEGVELTASDIEILNRSLEGAIEILTGGDPAKRDKLDFVMENLLKKRKNHLEKHNKTGDKLEQPPF